MANQLSVQVRWRLGCHHPAPLCNLSPILACAKPYGQHGLNRPEQPVPPLWTERRCNHPRQHHAQTHRQAGQLASIPAAPTHSGCSRQTARPPHPPTMTPSHAAASSATPERWVSATSPKMAHRKVRQPGNHIKRLLGRDIKLSVISAQMLCHRLGMLGLVVVLFVETDGERLYRATRTEPASAPRWRMNPPRRKEMRPEAHQPSSAWRLRLSAACPAHRLHHRANL